jgi:hypothetical protein
MPNIFTNILPISLQIGYRSLALFTEIHLLSVHVCVCARARAYTQTHTHAQTFLQVDELNSIQGNIVAPDNPDCPIIANENASTFMSGGT